MTNMLSGLFFQHFSNMNFILERRENPYPICVEIVADDCVILGISIRLNYADSVEGRGEFQKTI